MSKTVSRTERRKRESRGKIVRAAYKVFSTKGLFRATLDEISEEADVGKGTIYYHFPTKRELITYLTKSAIKDLLTYCKEQIAGIEDSSERVRKLTTAHFSFFNRRRALFSLLFFVRGALQQDLEKSYVQKMQSDYQEYIGFLAESLVYGIQRGAFRALDTMNQAYVLEGMITGFIFQWIINKRKGTFVDKAEPLIETFLHGVTSNENK